MMRDRRDFDDIGAAGPSADSAGPSSQNIDLNNYNLAELSAPVERGSGAANDAAAGGRYNLADADGGDMNGMEGGAHWGQYELTPTICRPAKMDRCLVENVAIAFALLANIGFNIGALASTILDYKEPGLHIAVSVFRVRGCLQGDCGNFALDEVFCSAFFGRAGGFFAFTFLSMIVSLVALILSICHVLGRGCLGRLSVVVLSIVALVLQLIAVILVGVLRSEKLCNNVSLGSLGFKYGPSFPLSLTTFLLLFLVTVFFIVKRCARPLRYRY